MADRYTVVRHIKGYTYKLGTDLSLVAAAIMCERLRRRGIVCTMREWIPGETIL